MSDFELLERQEVFEGRVLTVRLDKVRLPNGSCAELEVAHHRGAVAIVPLTGDGEVLLVRQFRYAVRSWVLEIPAGKLEEGEDPETCARRELEEETGFAPRELDSLGWIWSSPGFTDERIWLLTRSLLLKARIHLQPFPAQSVESVWRPAS